MLTKESLIEWAASWVPETSPSGEAGQRERFTKALTDELKDWRQPPDGPMSGNSSPREELWKAINRYVVACGGDPSAHVYGNTERQVAVAEVETSVDGVATALRAADRAEVVFTGGKW